MQTNSSSTSVSFANIDIKKIDDEIIFHKAHIAHMILLEAASSSLILLH